MNRDARRVLKSGLQTTSAFVLALAGAPFALVGGERYAWAGWATVLGMSGVGLVLLVSGLATDAAPKSRAEQGTMTLGFALVMCGIAVLTLHARDVGESGRFWAGIAALVLFGAATGLMGWNAVKPRRRSGE